MTLTQAMASVLLVRKWMGNEGGIVSLASTNAAQEALAHRAQASEPLISLRRDAPLPYPHGHEALYATLAPSELRW